MTKAQIEKQARYLARENREAEPEIRNVYWFPDDREVRLVELHPDVPASDDGKVNPFYFRDSPGDNLPAPSGIALIRPEEFGRLELPSSWGDWKDARELNGDGQ